MTALLESLTALLEYLDLLQCLKITVLGHVHLSACNINNSPHKLGFQFSMRAGDQKLRFDLVWPNYHRGSLDDGADRAHSFREIHRHITHIYNL